MLRNLHLSFDWQYIGEYFAKSCGLLRIYELYKKSFEIKYTPWLTLLLDQGKIMLT